MKLLIAGGAGYLGSALIPKLLERQYTVDVVDLFWFGNHLPPETGVVNADIFSLQVSDLAGYDQVIFLAGLSNDPMAEYSPSKNFIFNAAAPAYPRHTWRKLPSAKRYIYAVPARFTVTPRTSSMTRLRPCLRCIPMESPSSRVSRR